MPDILGLLINRIINEQTQSYNNTFNCSSFYDALKNIINKDNIKTSHNKNEIITRFTIDNKETLCTNTDYNKTIISFLKRRLKTLLNKRYKLTRNTFININDINIPINNNTIDFNNCSVSLSTFQIEEIFKDSNNKTLPELQDLFKSRTQSREQSQPDVITYKTNTAQFSITSISGIITIKYKDNEYTLMNNTKNNKLEIEINKKQN